MEKIDEWTAVVDAYVGKKVGNSWVRARCPGCEELDGKVDYKESLGYHHWSGGYNCFKCEMHGRLPISFRKRIVDDESPDLPVEEAPVLPRPAPSTADGFIPVFEEQPIVEAERLEWARSYLIDKRQLPEKTCIEAGIGAALYGRLAGRVIIPVFDYAEPGAPWKGWVARRVPGQPPTRTPLLDGIPYLNARNMDRQNLLYNEPALWRETTEPCFIMEGTMDALAAWPDAVAVLGKPVDGQFDLYGRARRPLAVCLDGDAWQVGQVLFWNLQFHGLDVTMLRLPPTKDPNDLGKANLLDLYRRSRGDR